MSNQALADEGAAILARIENDMRDFADLLDRAGVAPFADDKCNRQFVRQKRKWRDIRNNVSTYHEDLTECVQDGDVTVQFGGK